MNKNDKFLLAFLVFATAMGLMLHGHTTPGAPLILQVKHNREAVQSTNLSKLNKEKELVLNTAHGQLHILMDRTGAAVKASPCPDKLCVYQGKITHPGQTIACLPEQVVLTLSEQGKETELDAILR